MKKLVFMFVAIAAMSFASCNNGSKTEAPAEDTTAVDTTADSTATDSAAAATDTAVVK